MADDWDQFALADETAKGFEQFGSAEPLPREQYLSRLQSMFDSGASPEELMAFAQQNGDSLENLQEGLKARANGRKVIIRGGQAAAAPETVGQALYRGVGDLAEGVGDVAGLIGNPVNALINAAAGTNLSTDLGATFRDWTGAPDPVTGAEQAISAGTQGAASALATAGMAPLATGAGGATGVVANALADAPVANTVAGAVSGVSAENGERIGGPVGGIVGGLLGGVGGFTGARRIEAIAERFAQRVPRDVAVDSAGRLTDEGREIAARAGVSEEDVQRAYARRREDDLQRRRRDAETRRNAQTRREEVRNRTDRPAVIPDPQPTAEMPQTGRNLDRSTEAILQEMRRRGLPTETGANPPPPPRNVFTDAQEEGIPLSRGQAEQDFEVQNDENALRVSATREGSQARQWFEQQGQAIVAATQRLVAGFGDTLTNATERGQVVKDAIAQLRDSGAEGVRALYRQAEELGGESLLLETDGIQQRAVDVLIDEAVPEPVKRAVSQELARYGLIGTAEPMNEAGITRVALDSGAPISFRGPVKQLNAQNAEDLRKAINRLYLSDPTGASQSIKPAIDDALESALENAAGREGEVGRAYQAARSAYRQQRRTFNAKDIIENLVAVRKGTATDLVLPERAIAQVIGSGPKGLTNLTRVRDLLTSSAMPRAQEAWSAIQQQGLADIFDNAAVRDVSGDVVGISGAKLRTAIFKTFGTDKLRVLLGPEEFNRLMKLNRIIGHATIPLSGTTNPSGTATKLINYLRAGTLRFAGAIPGLGTAGEAIMGLAARGKEIAATRRTLAGITSYDGRQETGRRLDQQARQFVREYIELGTSGTLVPTSLATTSGINTGSDR